MAVLTCRTGLQNSHAFPGLIHNLKVTPPPPNTPSKINNKAARRPKRGIFPFLYYFFCVEGGGGGGGGSKLSSMMATLKRIEWNSTPSSPLKTRIRHVKAKTLGEIRGDVNEKWIYFVQKQLLARLKLGKSILSGVPSLDIHGIRPLRG